MVFKMNSDTDDFQSKPSPLGGRKRFRISHPSNLRRAGSSFLHNDIVKNPFVAGAIVLCVVLLLAAVYLPGISDLLKTEDPTGRGWLVVLFLSLVPFAFGQALRVFQRIRGIE